ncbi:hypothetical protein ExPECSC048_03882 [Escherichia coli]|nr:hypothetical protein ExPECSC048_03882 [Escherichia coli]SRB20912.1 Uncharacterised protein [Escherichia coli]
MGKAPASRTGGLESLHISFIKDVNVLTVWHKKQKSENP